MTDEEILKEWHWKCGEESERKRDLDLIRRVREDEREKCAKVADKQRKVFTGPQGGSLSQMDMSARAAQSCRDIATAIRARKDTP